MNPRDWIRRQLRLLRRAVKNLEALERQFAREEKKEAARRRLESGALDR